MHDAGCFAGCAEDGTTCPQRGSGFGCDHCRNHCCGCTGYNFDCGECVIGTAKCYNKDSYPCACQQAMWSSAGVNQSNTITITDDWRTRWTRPRRVSTSSRATRSACPSSSRASSCTPSACPRRCTIPSGERDRCRRKRVL